MSLKRLGTLLALLAMCWGMMGALGVIYESADTALGVDVAWAGDNDRPTADAPENEPPAEEEEDEGTDTTDVTNRVHDAVEQFVQLLSVFF